MNRLAKLFRVAGGIFLLGNIAMFFLPLLKIEQENYPEIIYSQFDYVKSLAQEGMAGERGMFILLAILLPLALSAVCGLWNIFTGRLQVIPCIGGVAVAVCNVVFYIECSILEPARLNEAQQYQYQVSLQLLLAFSLAAAALGILGLLLRPRRKKEASDVQDIPDVERIRQEQMQPQYAFVDERQAVSENPMQAGSVSDGPAMVGMAAGNPMSAGSVPDSPAPAGAGAGSVTPGQPRGVLVGLSGVFAGAEIPVRSGETLKFGRGVSNDLVFADAKKVSREHCLITWDRDAGNYQILDKSSNGCFINGSDDCIPQNMPITLPPGTILDIGSEENRFRME